MAAFLEISLHVVQERTYSEECSKIDEDDKASPAAMACGTAVKLALMFNEVVSWAEPSIGCSVQEGGATRDSDVHHPSPTVCLSLSDSPSLPSCFSLSLSPARSFLYKTPSPVVSAAFSDTIDVRASPRPRRANR